MSQYRNLTSGENNITDFQRSASVFKLTYISNALPMWSLPFSEGPHVKLHDGYWKVKLRRIIGPGYVYNHNIESDYFMNNFSTAVESLAICEFACELEWSFTSRQQLPRAAR